MKKLLGFFIGIALFAGCQKSDAVSEFTGNQSTYALQPGSQYAITGNATFKERKDGTTTIVIALKGITDNDQHPVHLHLGDISTDKALVAAWLTPVAGATGASETTISQLADGTTVSYKDLTKLAACVKVHLASVGQEANIILAAGNVGSSSAKVSSSGRLGVAVCKSN
jgi:hypothetical protein